MTVTGVLGVVARDLLVPDPGEQNDLSAIWVDDARDARVFGWHAAQAAAAIGRSRHRACRHRFPTHRL
jgi:hypothetical protein